MTVVLREWETFAGSNTPVVGATVNVRAASNIHPNASAVLASTASNTSGKWEFTGLADGLYDIDITYNGRVRHRKGNSSFSATLPLASVGVGTINDTVDPTVPPTTLQGTMDQYAAILKRLGGGPAYTTPGVGSSPPPAHPNGNFNFWQRGVSFVSPATLAYTADRVYWSGVAPGAVTISRDTDVPPVGINAIQTPYSYKLLVTTADIAIGAGDIYATTFPIEGYDISALSNGFTCSFWVKGAKTGIHAVTFLSTAATRSFVAEYSIVAANTWEYKQLVIPAFSAPTAWNYLNGIGMLMIFGLGIGSSFGGPPGAWQNIAWQGSVNQVNEMDTVGNTFKLALVNLVPGSVAQPMLPMGYATQLARVQRYYETHGFLAGATMQVSSYAGTGQAITGLRGFATPKGGVPTVTKVGVWTVGNCAQPGITTICADSYVLYSNVTAGPASCFFSTDTVDDGVIAEWNPM